jgi:mercuric ion transport protein
MEQTSKRPLPSILAAASILTGAGAIFAASCCVLPLVLGGLGAGAGLFSILEVLANYRMAILVLSAVLLVVRGLSTFADAPRAAQLRRW